MSVIVPSYVYSYIKLTVLNKLVMDDEELKQLKNFDDIEELINFISPFFPDIDIDNYTIEEIEKALYNVYIKLIGKIITVTPENMREFLRDFLLKYEIMNVRNLILGSILGLSKEEKRKNVNFLVEELLDRRDFIENLLNISSLDEIQLYMRDTMYNKVVREGIVYFKNNNEIFVLEAFLDKLYYENLLQSDINFNQYEKIMIPTYIDTLIEIYNLKIIYRGIINSIDKKLLKQFIIEDFLFLNKKEITSLVQQKNLKDFFNIINKNFSKNKDLKKIFEPLEVTTKNPIEKLEEMYREFYFRKYEEKIDNIDFTTIYNILKLLIKKEDEITNYIIPNIVRIIHNNFGVFEDILR